MASILALTQSQPVRTLKAGELLTREGDKGGDLYVLETGRLTVERDGVVIATISEPGALIGEMSVLLGTDHSADVRAQTTVTIRVIDNAIGFLERSPLLALHVATLACQRLNATSALLVHMRKEMAGRTAEQSILSRIFSTLTTVPVKGQFTHE